MWHRALRLGAFWAGFATCAGMGLFLYFNNSTITLNFWRWELKDVNIGLVAIAPLVAGVAIGYLYHLPARLHHVSEHMRHRGRVHELERELKDLRKGMDQMLELPDEEVVSKRSVIEAKPVPALEAPKNGGQLGAGSEELDTAMELPEEPPAQVRIKARMQPALPPKRVAETSKAAARRRKSAATPPAPPPSEPA